MPAIAPTSVRVISPVIKSFTKTPFCPTALPGGPFVSRTAATLSSPNVLPHGTGYHIPSPGSRLLKVASSLGASFHMRAVYWRVRPPADWLWYRVARTSTTLARTCGRPRIHGIWPRHLNRDMESLPCFVAPSRQYPALKKCRFMAFKASYATSNTTGSDTAGNSPNRHGTLTTLVKQYGKPGLIMYLSLSFLDLLMAWAIVHFLGFDVTAIAEKITGVTNYLKKLLGMDAPTSDESTSPRDSLVGNHRTPLWMKSLLLGYGLHKLLLPIRVPLTATLTPPFARFLYARGWLKVPKNVPVPKKGDLRFREKGREMFRRKRNVSS